MPNHSMVRGTHVMGGIKADIRAGINPSITLTGLTPIFTKILPFLIYSAAVRLF